MWTKHIFKPVLHLLVDHHKSRLSAGHKTGCDRSSVFFKMIVSRRNLQWVDSTTGLKQLCSLHIKTWLLERPLVSVKDLVSVKKKKRGQGGGLVVTKTSGVCKRPGVCKKGQGEGLIVAKASGVCKRPGVCKKGHGEGVGVTKTWCL